MISVVIPTRGSGDFGKLIALLASLKAQTIPPAEIIIVIDFDVAKRPLQQAIDQASLSLSGCELVCQEGYGITSARNRGVNRAKSEYVLLCDDDIRLQDKDILERLLDEYGASNQLILYPTIMFHDTGVVQSQGFTSYNWLMCWPVPKYSIDRKSKLRKKLSLKSFEPKPNRGNAQLLGSICIFTKTQIMKDYPYDEQFGFIYEDLEWSYRAYQGGIMLWVSDTIQVQHRERQKDVLERSYIDKPDHVYLKTKHRIWFVLKHATTTQLLLFYLIGFWLSNGWTLVYILLYGNKKYKLMRARRKGIVDGLGYERR